MSRLLCYNSPMMKLHIINDYKSIYPQLRGKDLTDALIRDCLGREDAGIERTDKGKPYVALVTADWLYVPAFSVAARTQAPVAFRGYDLDELRKLANPLPMPLVQFYPGTARLLPMASAELDNVVRFIRQHAGSTVKVSVNVPGTDDRQSYDLSLSRAKAIRSYIVAQGIDPDRINVAAYGNTKFKRGLTPCQAEVAFQ